MDLACQSVQRREVRKNGGPEAMADEPHISGCQKDYADEGRTRNVTPALLSIDGGLVFLVTPFGAEGQANG